MINPTKQDIGRSVVYQASYPDAPREDGIITSFNEKVVWVMYKNQQPSLDGQPTSREDLEWLSGKDNQ